jgi:hypothetical protein
MIKEKWENTKSMIKDKFQILEEKIEPMEFKTGLDTSQKIGDKEVIIFLSPIGKVKLEYITKPVIIEKKEHYSKRMGTAANTEYILSETDFVQRMEAYLEKDNEWQKIDASNFES